MDVLLKYQLPTIESCEGFAILKKNRKKNAHIYKHVFAIHFLYWKVLKSSVKHEIPLD